MSAQYYKHYETNRRASHENRPFTSRYNKGNPVTKKPRANCSHKNNNLEFTEINLTNKVFQATFIKFQKRKRIHIQKHFIKPLCVFCLLCLTSFSFASENEGTIPRIVVAPAEPLEVVLLCPEGSQHEGELIPKWVSNDEATDFFCNDSIKESEVSE